MGYRKYAEGGELFPVHFLSDCCQKINRKCHCNFEFAEGSKWIVKYYYPKMLSSMVALYCDGISIKAVSANSVSLHDGVVFFDMISVKFTN